MKLFMYVLYRSKTLTRLKVC